MLVTLATKNKADYIVQALESGRKVCVISIDKCFTRAQNVGEYIWLNMFCIKVNIYYASNVCMRGHLLLINLSEAE